MTQAMTEARPGLAGGQPCKCPEWLVCMRVILGRGPNQVTARYRVRVVCHRAWVCSRLHSTSFLPYFDARVSIPNFKGWHVCKGAKDATDDVGWS
jgi:hypothetical protein